MTKEKRTIFDLDKGEEHAVDPQLVLIRYNKKREIVSVKLVDSVLFNIPDLTGDGGYKIMSYQRWLTAYPIYADGKRIVEVTYKKIVGVE